MIKRNFQLSQFSFKKSYSYRFFARKNMALGIYIIWFIFLIPLFAFLLFLTINLGYVFLIKTELQNLADISAHAGAVALHKGPKEVQLAVLQVLRMNPIEGNILNKDNITFEMGNWDKKKKQFVQTNNNSKINSVKINLHYISSYSQVYTPDKNNPYLTVSAIGYIAHNNSKSSVSIVK